MPMKVFFMAPPCLLIAHTYAFPHFRLLERTGVRCRDVVEAPLRLLEHAFNRRNHHEIELDCRCPVPARIDVDTGGADVETRGCQPSTHGQRERVEPVDPNT